MIASVPMKQAKVSDQITVKHNKADTMLILLGYTAHHFVNCILICRNESYLNNFDALTRTAFH